MLELVSIPAIATIVYWIINVIKYALKDNETFKRLIPIISGLLGASLGLGCFYLVPNIIPTTNVFVAIVIGASSGLSAVGTNQILKQMLEKGSDSNGE